MTDLNTIIDFVRASRSRENAKTPLKHLGFFSSTNRLDIKHVPFYEPCLMLVLSGRKTLYEAQTPISCDVGEMLTVPGPSSHDMRNEPDARTHRYRALLIPFKIEQVERLIRAHGLVHAAPSQPVGILHFNPDMEIHAAIAHYLTTGNDTKLLTHRLMEILLLLSARQPALLGYALHRANWSSRVRSLLSSDLAHPWELAEVCAHLATSESTLRRNLRLEDVSFRVLLQELRLSTALMQLLQTPHPVHRIAYDCGYLSVSRFSSNFHKRFGVTPSQVRTAIAENEPLLNSTGKT